MRTPLAIPELTAAEAEALDTVYRTLYTVRRGAQQAIEHLSHIHQEIHLTKI